MIDSCERGMIDQNEPLGAEDLEILARSAYMLDASVDFITTDLLVCGSAANCRRLRVTRVGRKAEVRSFHTV